MGQSSEVCSELYDINARPEVFHYNSQFFHHSDFPPVASFKNGRYAPDKNEMPNKHPQRFTEKHLIESLNVNAVHPSKPVMFYNMLNQGNKRGK